MPLVRPVTSQASGEADASTVHVSEPGDDVAEYDTGAVPPEGATNVTVACVLPPEAVGVPGAFGGGVKFVVDVRIDPLKVHTATASSVAFDPPPAGNATVGYATPVPCVETC